MKTNLELCLKKSMRINAKNDFKAFREKFAANKIHSPYFLILFKPNCFDFARMAVIVSKKVSKKAVERNLIKRIVRETFRQLSLPPIDFLIIAKFQCLNVKNQTISFSLAKSLLEVHQHKLGHSL